jgi:hypothetical protein
MAKVVFEEGEHLTLEADMYECRGFDPLEKPKQVAGASDAKDAAEGVVRKFWPKPKPPYGIIRVEDAAHTLYLFEVKPSKEGEAVVTLLARCPQGGSFEPVTPVQS